MLDIDCSVHAKPLKLKLAPELHVAPGRPLKRKDNMGRISINKGKLQYTIHYYAQESRSAML